VNLAAVLPGDLSDPPPLPGESIPPSPGSLSRTHHPSPQYRRHPSV